jgi:2,5-diketo-D-gluconate reductase B
MCSSGFLGLCCRVYPQEAFPKPIPRPPARRASLAQGLPLSSGMKTEDRYVEVRGIRVPALGFGTWGLKGTSGAEAVADALRTGYRHIDTARSYGNETAVGEGIRRSGVPREEIFLVTKVWRDHLRRDALHKSVHASLRDLRLPWVDLLLIHWPSNQVPMEEPLGAMEELREEGSVRYIGVSNFTPEMVEHAATVAPILAIQSEYHPFLSQRALLEVAAAHDLMFTAYSPLARGRVANSRTLREIGRRHEKTAAQVALRWLLQQPRVTAIPRASRGRHRRENFDVFDFRLDEQEMERIAALDEAGRIVDPSFAPVWDR